MAEEQTDKKEEEQTESPALHTDAITEIVKGACDIRKEKDVFPKAKH